MFDATGIRGAFTLQAAINCFALVASCLMIPAWLLSPQQSREQLLQAQHETVALPVHDQHQQRQTSSSSGRRTGSAGSIELNSLAADAQKQQASAASTAACKDTSVRSDQHQPEACAAEATRTAGGAAHAAASGVRSTPPVNGASLTTTTCLPACDSSGLASSSAKDKPASRAFEEQAEVQQQQHQQQQLPKLNLAAVVSTMRDPIIFSQCLLLLLEQIVRSSLTIVLPAAMGTRQLVVGMVYLANVSH
jgi:hypothetical protein